MSRIVRRLFEYLERWRRFVTHDVWHIGRPGEVVPHGFLIKQIRVVILLVQSLLEGTLLLRASALTFTTMMAAVPFLALTFFVIQSLDLAEEMPKFIGGMVGAPQVKATTDEDMRRAIVQMLTQRVGEVPQGEGGGEAGLGGQDTDSDPGARPTPVQEQSPANAGPETKGQRPDDYMDPIEWVLTQAQKGADPAKIGITGMLFVLITVLGLIQNIDSSFNAIWGVARTRSWLRIFADYLLVVLILPVLLAGVLSVSAILENKEILGRLGPFAAAIRGTQYVVIWAAFSALYFLVPNTKVQFRCALLGGVVAGTVWCILSGAYVNFQVGLSRYGMFYSGLALVPLLLMWIYASWVTLLFGAELTFAYQNEKTFAMERLAAGSSYAYKEALGIRTMIETGRRFDAGKPGLAGAEAAEQWGVPIRLMNDTLDILEQAGLVRRCVTEPPTYQPGRSLTRIALRDVVLALRESGRDPSDLLDEPALQPILAEVNAWGCQHMGRTLADFVLDSDAAAKTESTEDRVCS